MEKVKVAIIGTGNIGTDLLVKILRSSSLECTLFAGKSTASEGIKFAKKIGVKTSINSIKDIEDNPDCCDIVFDATSAAVHFFNAPILRKLRKFTIDLTPSKIGKMCIPVLNLDEALNHHNVNLVTCSGQATIPIIDVIKKIHPRINYFEIVASISSKSAGMGTRANIDEFTQTTRDAIIEFTGVQESKAIIILNPAEPPIIMHNTIYAQIEKANVDLIHKGILEVSEKIRRYVPGYKVVLEPVAENGRVTTVVEVLGLGDYLPEYSGNLDIITCAAINIAEEYAKRKILHLKD